MTQRQLQAMSNFLTRRLTQLNKSADAYSKAEDLLMRMTYDSVLITAEVIRDMLNAAIVETAIEESEHQNSLEMFLKDLPSCIPDSGVISASGTSSSTNEDLSDLPPLA